MCVGLLHFYHLCTTTVILPVNVLVVFPKRLNASLIKLRIALCLNDAIIKHIWWFITQDFIKPGYCCIVCYAKGNLFECMLKASNPHVFGRLKCYGEKIGVFLFSFPFLDAKCCKPK